MIYQKMYDLILELNSSKKSYNIIEAILRTLDIDLNLHPIEDIKNNVNIPYDLNNKLKDLAVPFGLFSINIKGNELLENIHDAEEVNNEIYQKLLNNMNPKMNKHFKNTKKRFIKSQKKTIKNNKRRS